MSPNIRLCAYRLFIPCVIFACTWLFTGFDHAAVAQEAYRPIYQTIINDINEIRWSLDSQSLVFIDYGLGVGVREIKWVTYNINTQQITKSVNWPLQPVFSSSQIETFEMDIESDGQPYCTYFSPDKRYMAYVARKSTMRKVHWHNPLGVADMKTGEHIITDVSIDEGFYVVWSKDGSTFAAHTLAQEPYPIDVVYYVTGFSSALKDLASEDITERLTIGNDIVPVSGVYDISPDGKKVLVESGRRL